MNTDPVLNYERTPRLVPVARFSDAGEARLAASRLESEDVDCHVDELLPRHGLGAGAATLSVEGDQLARAVEVLSATPARRCLLVNAALPVKEADDRAGGAGLLRAIVGQIRKLVRRS